MGSDLISIDLRVLLALVEMLAGREEGRTVLTRSWRPVQPITLITHQLRSSLFRRRTLTGNRERQGSKDHASGSGPQQIKTITELDVHSEVDASRDLHVGDSGDDPMKDDGVDD